MPERHTKSDKSNVVTDGRTDKAGYRVTCTRLKTTFYKLSCWAVSACTRMCTLTCKHSKAFMRLSLSFFPLASNASRCTYQWFSPDIISATCELM